MVELCLIIKQKENNFLILQNKRKKPYLNMSCTHGKHLAYTYSLRSQLL